jgi:hypothetical protein
MASIEQPLAAAFDEATLRVECAPKVLVLTPAPFRHALIQRLTVFDVTGLCGAIVTINNLSEFDGERRLPVRCT